MPESPPSNAEGVGLITDWVTRIPHAAEQLNLGIAITETEC